MIRNRMLAFALLFAATPSFAAEGATNRPTNAEMTAIFNADQKDRQGPVIDGNTVGQKDDVRRKRTQALLHADALHSGDDFYHAAFVFQHGGTPDDYLKAHLLATIAVARGKVEATWIAAATLDRYLQAIGKPQILGTQFRVGADGRATQEPFDRSLGSDSLRAALGVPPLAKQDERRAELEKDARPKSVVMPVRLSSALLRPHPRRRSQQRQNQFAVARFPRRRPCLVGHVFAGSWWGRYMAQPRPRTLWAILSVWHRTPNR